MAVFKTGQGRPVSHCHIPTPPCAREEHSSDQLEVISAWLKRHHPETEELQQATREYNCHGHALAASHGWFNDPRLFFADDYFEVSFENPQVGDVVIYYNDGVLMHTAVITRVSNGQTITLHSKWGDGPEVSHSLLDVMEEYGRPVRILRRRAGLEPLVALTSEVSMTDVEATEERIKKAIERFSDPDIYLRVIFASTPEAARKIIESLPGVMEMIDIGSEAGRAVLSFLEGEEILVGDQLSSIALYLLQRIPTKEATQPLARLIKSSKFTGVNRHLAAEAFLTSSGIETISEDPLLVALREAENFL